VEMPHRQPLKIARGKRCRPRAIHSPSTAGRCSSRISSAMLFPSDAGASHLRHWVKVKNPKAPGGEARGRGLGALMRGPISEAIIIVALGFFIGGIAGGIIHFTFDSSNAIVPHPASGHALGGAPDYPKQ
jgi:hypothetical protein